MSPRLKVALSLLTPCECLADIGSDHGYLITTAVKTGVAKRGVAVEINELPFEQTCKTVRTYGLTSNIDVRLGDGLKPLHLGEAHALCIAGMGGGTIKGILSAGHDRLSAVSQLILQPNVDAGELRAYLLQNRFVIRDERLVTDGDFIYQVIKAAPGAEGQGYSPLELEYGRINLNRCDVLLQQVINRDIAHWEAVLKQLSNAKSDTVAAKREKIGDWLKELKGVL